MANLLMRGGLSPLEPIDIDDVLTHNLIGGNSGNLVYAYSVFRTLFTEGTRIDVDGYACERGTWTDADIERVNATYDAYVIPLADAFRPGFAGSLRNMTSAIEKLTIPCHVIGVGVRAPLGADVAAGLACDKEARRFLRAVLRKSALVGLRGATTARYLEHLGFAQGSSYAVIGCPSMYGFGRSLRQRPLRAGKNARVSVNFNTKTKRPAMRWLVKLARRRENGQYVAQRLPELVTLYAGAGNNLAAGKACFPSTLAHPLYQQDKVRFFLSAHSWIEDMRTVGLSIGSRLHGTVAAILGGAPVVFSPCDARTQELQEYHAFPTVPQLELGPDVRLRDVLEAVDLESHLRRQGENFDRYLGFLHANGLATIFDADPERHDAPLDAEIAKLDPGAGRCTSVLTCSRAEAIGRTSTYLNVQVNREVARALRDALGTAPDANAAHTTGARTGAEPPAGGRLRGALRKLSTP